MNSHGRRRLPFAPLGTSQHPAPADGFKQRERRNGDRVILRPLRDNERTGADVHHGVPQISRKAAQSAAEAMGRLGFPRSAAVGIDRSALHTDEVNAQ